MNLTAYTTSAGSFTGGATAVTPLRSVSTDHCIFICNVSAVMVVEFASIGDLDVSLTNSAFAH
jgi:energy-converting hydrogenase Eha subunit C